MLKDLVAEAKKLNDIGGDWDRRNRLKVYEAYYLLTVRDLKGVRNSSAKLTTLLEKQPSLSRKKFPCRLQKSFSTAWLLSLAWSCAHTSSSCSTHY